MLAERREALLDLSLNHLPAAIARLERLRREQAARGVRHPYFSAIPDLVECYVRAGSPSMGAELVADFAEVAGPAAPPTAYAAIPAYRALLADPHAYEALFEESIALDEKTGMHFFKARTLLCLGERLRRDRRRVDARVALRAAGDIFQRLEAEPWLRRVELELAATGEVLGPRAAMASSSSRRRSCRSRCWWPRADATRTWPPSCSCRSEPWSSTSARFSASWASSRERPWPPGSPRLAASGPYRSRLL